MTLQECKLVANPQSLILTGDVGDLLCCETESEQVFVLCLMLRTA